MTRSRSSERSSPRRASPGRLAAWIWDPVWILPLLSVQTATMVLFGSSATSFPGVPGALGALLAVAAGIASGPIAGSMVALAGGWIFVAFVTELDPTSELTIAIWVIAAISAGGISARLRRADRLRANALVRERLAANRLHRLQSVTGALAGATTEEEVARSAIEAATAALGADAAGLTVRTKDPDTLQVLASSARDGETVDAWRPYSIHTPIPAAEIVRRGRPLYIETRRELLARFPMVSKIEEGRRFGAFAGVPIGIADEVFGALALGFHDDHMVPPEERGLLAAIAHQAAVALKRIRAVDDERRARATAEHAEDRLRKLQAVTDAANAAIGLNDMLSGVLPLVRGSVLADGASFLLADDRGNLRLQASDGPEGADPHHTDDIPIPPGVGASGRVASTGRSLVIDRLTEEDSVSQLLGGRRSYVGVPVKVAGRVAGVLHASSRTQAAFLREDADFLQSIADSLAATIERTRAFDQRDRMASALERALLPMSLPGIPGFEVATMYRPSHFGADVGGDFYDVFGEGNVWYLAIGDVCGKGPEAAAIMGMTRVALRSLAREDDARPLPQILTLLNGFLLDSELMGDRFCTVCVARLELSEKEAVVTTCLGGHPPPYRLRDGGGLDAVGRPGSLLGLLEGVSLHETRVELEAGESIVLFTDGVTELSVEHPEQGEGMLRSTLSVAWSEDAAGIVKTVERTLIEPRGDLRDDAALVVAKRL